MTNTKHKYEELFKSWDFNKKSNNDMMLDLQKLGVSDIEVDSVINEYNKKKLLKRHQNGIN